MRKSGGSIGWNDILLRWVGLFGLASIGSGQNGYGLCPHTAARPVFDPKLQNIHMHIHRYSSAYCSQLYTMLTSACVEQFQCNT